MEIMEEGNLMDRVPILLQRDLQYYQDKQSVLQETICAGVVGGKLDFPRYASFAAVKIVRWWEDEYYAAYRKSSGFLYIAENDISNSQEEQNEVSTGEIVKDSGPEKFVSLITKSADVLMAHLHCLSQEALDHADLTVLTATIGATALIKNYLWVYMQSAKVCICPPKGEDKGGALRLSYKQFSEMTEALAERLLDLHCRILMLYILQDADCLDWENEQPFFEAERGSYTIQMWWLYIKGTKDDLWNSIPPQMAQRIFAGMLNETLTVLTVRYTQITPSYARSQLLLVDMANILFCVSELLGYVSDNCEAYLGIKMMHQNKTIRDIHAKCQELFSCLLLRGASLGTLFKLFKKGSKSPDLFSSGEGLPSPWIMFTLPNHFHASNFINSVSKSSELGSNTAISLELKILLAAPQPSWSLLLKVLLMREASISSIILHHLMDNLPSNDSFMSSLKLPFAMKHSNIVCDGFLCFGECFNLDCIIANHKDPIGQNNYLIILALTFILVGVGKTSDIEKALISWLVTGSNSQWEDCLDKRQVWNQKRPPWLEGILQFIYPALDGVVQILVNAVQTGATIFKAISLALACLSEIWDCIPEGLYKVTVLLDEAISSSIRPLGESVLIQVLFMALYTKLLDTGEKEEQNIVQGDISISTRVTVYQMLAEAICSVDEDNKHTDQINLLLQQAKATTYISQNDLKDIKNGIGLSTISTIEFDDLENNIDKTQAYEMIEKFDVESSDFISELLVSDILISNIGKQSLQICYTYLKNNEEWLFQKLGINSIPDNEFQRHAGQNIQKSSEPILRTMFYINQKPFDQLFTGTLNIDYSSWLQTPMSISAERAWFQISKRTEFCENCKLSLHEATMVASITNCFKK